MITVKIQLVSKSEVSVEEAATLIKKTFGTKEVTSDEKARIVRIKLNQLDAWQFEWLHHHPIALQHIKSYQVLPALEPWQIEALEELLARGEVSPTTATTVTNNRLHLESSFYGESRYHVITRRPGNGIVMDQTDHDEKYQQRVTFEEDEINALLRQQLAWYWTDVQKQNERAATTDDFLSDESFIDLDEHPF